MSKKPKSLLPKNKIYIRDEVTGEVVSQEIVDPKLARYAFAGDFVAKYAQHFEENGLGVLEELMRKNPAKYAEIGLKLLPVFKEESEPPLPEGFKDMYEEIKQNRKAIEGEVKKGDSGTT